MDRNQKTGFEGLRAGSTQDDAGREAGSNDVRMLADLELMLVGGGDIVIDWG